MTVKNNVYFMLPYAKQCSLEGKGVLKCQNERIYNLFGSYLKYIIIILSLDHLYKNKQVYFNFLTHLDNVITIVTVIVLN